MLGGPLSLLMTLISASMFAWIILGLPVAAYEPLKIPYFFWYYRHDPHVMDAFAWSAIAGGTLLAFFIYALWTQSPPRGATRLRGKRRLLRHRVRASSGDALRLIECKVLPLGSPEREGIEAFEDSSDGTEIFAPGLPILKGSIVVDVARAVHVRLIFVELNRCS